mgnify:CR=1 FL=1
MVESWDNVSRFQNEADFFITEHLSVAKHPEADGHSAKWGSANDFYVGVC